MTSSQVGIYLRISLDRTGAGLGVERQREDCQELADRHGWTVEDIYVDNDISAYSGKRRPEYERLLADVQAGRITAVVAWHTDRLHRSPAELEHYISVCEPRGVATHTVRAGDLDLSTAAGRMVARMLGAAARHESEQKSERLRRQRQQKQAAGLWVGGRRPFGREADGMTIREDEAEMIRDATAAVLAGVSMRSIAAQWNGTGSTTITGKDWNGNAVRNLLLRPSNAGLVGKGDRIVGEASWGPIVERGTWEALRVKLKDPGRRTNGGNTSRKLLGSFLFRCGECGGLLMSGGLTESGQARYRCGTDGCHLRRVSEPIDQTVRAVVAKDLRKRGADLLRVDTADEAGALREQLTALEARAVEIGVELADVNAKRGVRALVAANEAIETEIEQVEARLGRLSAGSLLAEVVNAPDPGAAFLSLDNDRQRVVISARWAVRVLKASRGRSKGGFNPESVQCITHS